MKDISILENQVLGMVNGSNGKLKALKKRGPYPLKDDVYELADENHISIADALDWFELHKSRNFKTEDGKEIKNWKGACTNWCKLRERKRKGGN